MLLCELCVCLTLCRIGTIAAELITDNNGNSFAQLDDIGISNNVDNSLDYHDDENIAGIPNTDYPTYHTIPRTSFSCRGRNRWGYYADVEAACQVFHICENQYSKVSFLCPIGSVFNQRHLICDWWYNFDCEPEIQLLEEEARPNGYTPLLPAQQELTVVGASSDVSVSVSVLPPASMTRIRKGRQQVGVNNKASTRGLHLFQQTIHQPQSEVMDIVPTSNTNTDKSSTTKLPRQPPREQRRNSKRINIYKSRINIKTSNDNATTASTAGNMSAVSR